MGLLPTGAYICVGERMNAMPYDERDEQSGRFTPEFADEEFLDAVRGGASTSEVADDVGCKYRTAYERLQRLEEAGRVSARKIGKTYLWETDEPAAAAGTEPEPEPPSETPDPDPVEEPEPERDLQALTEAVVDAIAAGWDANGRFQARTAAARAVLRHAVETGDYVSKSAAVEQFREEYPVPGQNAETWWRQNARAVLAEVSNDYSRGHGGYRVTREDLETFLEDDQPANGE